MCNVIRTTTNIIIIPTGAHLRIEIRRGVVDQPLEKTIGPHTIKNQEDGKVDQGQGTERGKKYAITIENIEMERSITIPVISKVTEENINTRLRVIITIMIDMELTGRKRNEWIDPDLDS